MSSLYLTLCAVSARILRKLEPYPVFNMLQDPSTLKQWRQRLIFGRTLRWVPQASSGLSFIVLTAMVRRCHSENNFNVFGRLNEREYFRAVRLFALCRLVCDRTVLGVGRLHIGSGANRGPVRAHRGVGLHLRLRDCSVVLDMLTATGSQMCTTQCLTCLQVEWKELYMWFMTWTLAHITTDIYLARLNLKDLQDYNNFQFCEKMP